MSNNHTFTEKLRSLGLRPTKQRIEICKLLYNRTSTFHFTINDLKNILNTISKKKISLATIYNTIHALKKKGYLKEISINSGGTFFDTNVTKHHHIAHLHNTRLMDVEESLTKVSSSATLPRRPFHLVFVKGV